MSMLARGLDRAKRGYASGALRRREAGCENRSDPPPAPASTPKLTEPVGIEFSGRRWIVIRAKPGQEKRCCDDLGALGAMSYLPMGRKVLFRRPLKPGASRRRVVVEFPVFAPYVFVGVAEGREIDKHSSDRIASVVGDVGGQWRAPIAALERINALELAGVWDASRSWADKSRFGKGDLVRVNGGAFAGFRGVVMGLGRALRVELHQALFGASQRVTIDACHLQRIDA